MSRMAHPSTETAHSPPEMEPAEPVPAPMVANEPPDGPEGPRNSGVPVTEIRLVEGLPVEHLQQELLLASRSTDVGHRVLAFYLHEMQERGLHQLLGFASAVHFAQVRLDLSRRQARDLLAVGAALGSLRRIDEAFGEGRLSWTKTRLLAKVAEPETESAWLAKALELPVRQLERLVAMSEKGRPPRADGKGLPEVKLTVKIRLAPLDHETWEQARRKLSAQAGEELSDAAALATVARLVLRLDAEEDGLRGGGESLFRIVVDRCSECRASAVRTDDGPVDIDPATAEMVACEAPTVAVTDAPGGARAPSASDGCQPQQGIDRPTPRVIRDRILARDGYRCRSCGGRHDLMAHHLVYRSAGGRTEEKNLVGLCARCHALVHAGLLRIEGEAPHELRFLDAKGHPLNLRPAPPDGGITVLKVAGGARAPCG